MIFCSSSLSHYIHITLFTIMYYFPQVRLLDDLDSDVEAATDTLHVSTDIMPCHARTCNPFYIFKDIICNQTYHLFFLIILIILIVVFSRQVFARKY